MHAEGPRRRGPVARVLRQRTPDERSLEVAGGVLEVGRRREHAARGGRARQRWQGGRDGELGVEILCPQHDGPAPRRRARCPERHAQEHVFELADVAGPGVALEGGDGARVEVHTSQPELAAGGVAEVTGQERDVVGTVPQRRHAQRIHVEAMEEVGPELPLAHRAFEVAVAGRDQAHVGADRLV